MVNPLSISVQANGKKRIILDLRYVNKFLHKMRIKYEDWKTTMPHFALGIYMFSFDLKSGYHHIEIFEGHQIYLGFFLEALYSNSNRTKFHVFTVLPFGLSSAPHVFTKILKPLEKHWRLKTVKRLASFTGQVICTAPVSGNISRIMSRHCIMSTS